MAKLTEKTIFQWLRDLEGKHLMIRSEELKLRNRIKRLHEKHGWEMDKTDSPLSRTWQILLWAERKYKKRRRLLGFVIRRDLQGYITIELYIVGHFRNWLLMNGRDLCPKCYKVIDKKYLDNNGMCLECVIANNYKCQVCGVSYADNKTVTVPRTIEWVEMCKYGGLHSMKPICEHCRKDAQSKYIVFMERLYQMNTDLWVKHEGCRYKLTVVAIPIEGNPEEYIYPFKEKPTQEEIRQITKSLMKEGYIDFETKVTDVELLFH